MRTGGANQTLRRAALAAVAIALFVGGGAPVADAAQPYPADFFGISAGADLAQLPAAVLNREMDLMQQAGVHWVRAAVPWAQVQRVEKDPDQWESIDRVVDAAASRHMQVLGIVDNPPEWAKQNIPRIPCKVQPPFDLTAYATFTGALARRYPASVLSAIELENSPNLGGLWKHPDPCAYAQLMKQSYPARRADERHVERRSRVRGDTGADDARRDRRMAQAPVRRTVLLLRARRQRHQPEGQERLVRARVARSLPSEAGVHGVPQARDREGRGYLSRA